MADFNNEYDQEITKQSLGAQKKIKKIKPEEGSRCNQAIIPQLREVTEPTLYQNFRVSSYKKNNAQICQNVRGILKEELKINPQCRDDKVLFFDEIFQDKEVREQILRAFPQACYSLIMNVQL